MKDVYIRKLKTKSFYCLEKVDSLKNVEKPIVQKEEEIVVLDD